MWDAGIEMADEWRARLPKADSHGQKVVEMAGACRQITLMVIAKAGFGLSIDWDEWSDEVGEAKSGGDRHPSRNCKVPRPQESASQGKSPPARRFR
jgi:hypothetical protein